MPRESTLEKYIKDFVDYKVNEDVYLCLRDSIELRSATRRKKSIILASFWANLLQHRLNYPPNKHHYTETTSSDAHQHLVLNTSDVKFDVDMTTGSLVISGEFVYEWFTQKFKSILDHFDERFDKTWVFERTPTGDLPTRNSTNHGCRVHGDRSDRKAETEAYLLLESRGQVTEAATVAEKIRKHSVHLISEAGDMSIAKPIWTADEVTNQLIALRHGGVYSSMNYVYPLWRSFLFRCFARKGTQVVLSTPQLDVERLDEIIQVYLQTRQTASLHSFYVSYHCDNTTVAAVQKKVLEKYCAHKQTLIESMIFKRMIYPMRRLLASFVAAIDSDGDVQVLLLGANFHGCHLATETTTSVSFLTMTEKDFMRHYVTPLEIPSVSALST